jgi:hypothetical protein
MTKLSNRLLVLAFSAMFFVSSIILLIASTARDLVPAWGGYLDVGMVLLIAFSGFMIYQRGNVGAYDDTSYQVAIYLFPLILVSMWIYRDMLDFNILLPGVAWRIYFLLSILPYALHLWKMEGRP